MKRVFLVAVCVASLIATVCGSSLALDYHLVKLRPSSSTAYSISDLGQAVGVASNTAVLLVE